MFLANNINLTNGILGGVIIGISSTSFLVFTGRMTGISGILEDAILFRMGQDNKWWTWGYLGGLLTTGIIVSQIDPGAFGSPGATSLTLHPMAVDVPLDTAFAAFLASLFALSWPC